MEAYIYTYVNKETQKTYIGSRSAYKGKAEDDFNIKYFSSSKNPQFWEDMKNGKLDGSIILKMNCENAGVKIVEIEAQIIEAFWKKYGKQNSYNIKCNGKWNTSGMHFKPTYGMRGKHHSEEYKQIKSKLYTGSGNPFYGKHWNQNQIDAMKQLTGENSPAYRNKYWLGRHHTEESKKKIGDANRGHKHTEETKKLISEKKKGICTLPNGHKPETKAQISKTKTGKPDTKYKFLNDKGEIVLLDMGNRNRWHKDWPLIDDTPIKFEKQY